MTNNNFEGLITEIDEVLRMIAREPANSSFAKMLAQRVFNQLDQIAAGNEAKGIATAAFCAQKLTPGNGLHEKFMVTLQDRLQALAKNNLAQATRYARDLCDIFPANGAVHELGQRLQVELGQSPPIASTRPVPETAVILPFKRPAGPR